MKSQYKIDPDTNELIEYHEGDISIVNVIEFLKSRFTEAKFKPGIRSIVDIRNANILFQPNQVEIIVCLFKRFQRVIDGKWALITSTPEQANIAFHLECLMKEFPVEVKTFNSVPLAKDWLK